MAAPGTPRTGTPALSVVTIVAGRRPHLRNLYGGLERSPLSAELELELVVVLMDGSDHGLEEGRVRISSVSIDGEAGLPLAAARNLGAEAARSDSLLFLDVDCVPARDLPAAAHAALAGDSAAGEALMMAPVGYLPPGVPGDGPGWNWSEEDLADAAEWIPGRPRAPRPFATVAPQLFWSLAFAVGRDTLLGRIGGFDPGYRGYGAEDTDLGLRADAAGVPLLWLGGCDGGPCPAAFHQDHPSYSPPANHLRAIVANAHRFRRRWGFWPMEGWLQRFAEHGWISWEPDGDRLDVEREPTDAELEPLRVRRGRRRPALQQRAPDAPLPKRLLR